MCRKTCEHGERGFLEPKSPVVQSKANRRTSEAVPALTHFERMEVRTLRCEGASSNELDKGDEWAPKLTQHTVFTELGIPYGTRVLGERSHHSSLRWGQPIAWRRVTGLEASEREGMRDAESQPEWMPRSGKRYTLKGVRTVWRGADGKGQDDTVPRQLPTLLQKLALRDGERLTFPACKHSQVGVQSEVVIASSCLNDKTPM
jgi:hypothetical protein